MERSHTAAAVEPDGSASGAAAGLLNPLRSPSSAARAQELGFDVPERFASGLDFFPPPPLCEAAPPGRKTADTGASFASRWRTSPGEYQFFRPPAALETMPEIWQFFVGPFHPARATERFEWSSIPLRKGKRDEFRSAPALPHC